MIFLTVGTQKFQFNRLIRFIDEIVNDEMIREEVFAQIGNSDYIPKNFEYKRFLEKNEFEEKISKSNIIICHAGVGTIIAAIKKNKKVIVVPRLKKYKEHIDNHQLEIAEAFSKKNFLITTGEELESIIKLLGRINDMQFAKYESSNQKLQDIIERFIGDNYE